MSNPNVHEVVSAIHKRVREQAASYEAPTVLEDWSNDLVKLNNAYATAYSARNLVGSAPKLPPTFIGILAGWVTSIVQRVLFWYTPQIHHFQEATSAVLNRLCSLEERKFRSFLAMADRLERLELEMRLTSANRTDVGGRDSESSQSDESVERRHDNLHSRSGIDPNAFYASLRRRLQPTQGTNSTELRTYLSVIRNLEPKIPEGTWLDVGCGCGEWLQIARDNGYQAVGVDRSVGAVLRCREDGLNVTERDALEFVSSAESQSLAVVTAFHVLEHCSFEYSLNLVHQIGRCLKPEGVLLIQTLHPANLLIAAEQFWIDPTRHRPIPIALMEFLLEYWGFNVAHRFELDPRPDSEHLPLRDLELANRLDHLLYGPQKYALIGKLRG